MAFNSSVSKPRQRAPKRMKTTPEASVVFSAQSQSHFDPLSLLAEAAFEYSQETYPPREDKVSAKRFLAQNGYGEISVQLIEAITSPENTSSICQQGWKTAYKRRSKIINLILI